MNWAEYFGVRLDTIYKIDNADSIDDIFGDWIKGTNVRYQLKKKLAENEIILSGSGYRKFYQFHCKFRPELKEMVIVNITYKHFYQYFLYGIVMLSFRAGGFFLMGENDSWSFGIYVLFLLGTTFFGTIWNSSGGINQIRSELESKLRDRKLLFKRLK